MVANLFVCLFRMTLDSLIFNDLPSESCCVWFSVLENVFLFACFSVLNNKKERDKPKTREFLQSLLAFTDFIQVSVSLLARKPVFVGYRPGLTQTGHITIEHG